MNVDRLAKEFLAAYKTYKRSPGERERVRNLRYLMGMADAIAALANIKNHGVVFAVMESQTPAELATKLKELIK